jgi:hypothetical protein
MTELAVVVAAYDEIGDQIVGVLEDYSWSSPDGLDGAQARSLLNRAEFVVAHNAEFDRGVLARELPGTEKCHWLCSLRGIDWKGVAGVGSESLVRRSEKTYLARLLSAAASK